MQPVTEYAWAAGIFDGEGCICIERHRPRRQSGERSVKFRFRIRVAMTSVEAVQKLKTVFGFGNIVIEQRDKQGWKTKYTWSCESEKAATAVTLMLPYLTVKHKEGCLGLQFMEFQRQSVPVSRGCKGANYRTLQTRQTFYEQMLTLKVSKKRGFVPLPLASFEELLKARENGINQQQLGV